MTDSNVNSEKLKALEEALKLINKELKTDSGTLISKMSDKASMNVETISTGSVVLDSISGGGLAKGRISEIYGAESSGKCLTKDTYINTAQGMMTVQELFESQGFDTEAREEISDVRNLGLKAVNENGYLESIEAFTHNGNKEVRRIVLEDGRHLTATLNHPVRVRNDKQIVWKQVGELVVGDVVVSLLGDAEKMGTDTLSENTVQLLAMLTTCGYIETRFDNFALTTLFDEKLFSEFPKVVKKAAKELHLKEKIELVTKEDGITRTLHVHGIEMKNRLLELLETKDGQRENARIPLSIRNSTTETKRLYVETLFRCTGFYTMREYGQENSIGFEIKSKKFAEELQLTLRSLGYKSNLEQNGDEDNGYGTTYIRLTGESAERFSNSSKRLLPFQTKVTHTYNTRSYEKIVEIHEMGKQPTFDIAMKTTHSFIANGMINHNTTIALLAAADVQKNGGTVAFVDLENALDPRYAAKLGVDIPNLAVSQPDHAEQALELVERLAQSGVVDLIVVDSVAALVPKAELEGTLDQQTMAVVARLMSRSLKKLVKTANMSGTTIIFINQTRDNIGAFSPMGTPQITPGGKALKFFASQRIEVKRSKQVKNGDKVIGTMIKLKVVKNKIAAPFGTGETMLTFNVGVNKAGEIIEVAPEYGVIERPNARTYVDPVTGEKLGTSKADALERLENDPVLLKRMQDDLKRAMQDADVSPDDEAEELLDE